MLIEAIEAFVASWNQDASPFEWTNRPGPVRAVALEKKEEINAVASETGRPGFLKTL